MDNRYSRESSVSGDPQSKLIKRVATIGAIVVGLAILMAILDSFFGYVIFKVGDNEVGIKFRANQPYQVVGPGIYTELGLWEDMKVIKVKGLPFTMKDPEILTRDQQRVGVDIGGTVHRPGLEKANELIANWSSYSSFYLDDNTLVGPITADGTPTGLMQSLGQQASKVCVGDLNFSEAVVGSARDVLRACIDVEVDKLAQGYGLEVRNVVVPNVHLADAVQKMLDQITDARFATQLSQQNEAKARADAGRDQAVEEGKIRVEQARIQEKAKQDKLTADLNRQTLEAQMASIKAQKDNDLLAAQKDLEIAKVRKTVAEENSKSEIAPEAAKAAMFSANPAYVSYLNQMNWSNAYSRMDKVFLPPGTSPFFMVGSNGNGPVVTYPIGGSPAVTPTQVTTP